jgi:HEPN domain-containing protein
MSDPDTAAARLWMSLAIGDLDAAQTMLEAGTPAAIRIAAQHAQQAAEKAMKAAIAVAGPEPTRTHDLVAIARRVPAEAGIAQLGVDLDRLSAALAAGRYPDPADPPYTTDEAAVLVRAARSITDAVGVYLQTQGIDPGEAQGR